MREYYYSLEEIVKNPSKEDKIDILENLKKDLKEDPTQFMECHTGTQIVMGLIYVSVGEKKANEFYPLYCNFFMDYPNLDSTEVINTLENYICKLKNE